MPIRQGGILASRASTWPRDHFCRSTMAPRASWPTTWNEFLPISMPITAIAVLGVWDMACSLSLVPLAQLRLLAGQEHGRTIPLADISKSKQTETAETRSTAAQLRKSFCHRKGIEPTFREGSPRSCAKMWQSEIESRLGRIGVQHEPSR